MKFRVELVWTDNEENDASSIFLTSDGRVVLQGRAISPLERQALALPADGEMISVDRNLIRAIKDMLLSAARCGGARMRGPRRGTIENDGPCA